MVHIIKDSRWNIRDLNLIDPMHPELAVDPLGILRPANKLLHQLPLVSVVSLLIV